MNIGVKYNIPLIPEGTQWYSRIPDGTTWYPVVLIIYIGKISLVPSVTSGPKTVNSSMIPVPYMRSRPKTVGSSVPETVISSMSQTPPEGEVY